VILSHSAYSNQYYHSEISGSVKGERKGGRWWNRGNTRLKIAGANDYPEDVGVSRILESLSGEDETGGHILVFILKLVIDL
jgi:hypothetical protein